MSDFQETRETFEKRMSEFAALGSDWNSYDALPIKPEAIDGMRFVFDVLDAAGKLRGVYFVPCADGNTSIETHDNSVMIEIQSRDNFEAVAFDAKFNVEESATVDRAGLADFIMRRMKP